MAKSVAESYGATAEVEMHMVAPATVNDERP
jgi:metal-dependent amidase/aminoacylase/carboxypeptidase family protein